MVLRFQAMRKAEPDEKVWGHWGFFYSRTTHMKLMMLP